MRRPTAPQTAAENTTIRTTNWSVDTAGPLTHVRNGANTTVVQQPSSARVSEKCLAIARRQCASPAAEYHLAEDYTPRGEADLAFSCGVLHRIPPGERAAAIRYVWDCLCPGGIVAVWENNAWSLAARYTMWANPFDRGARPLSARGVRRLLGAEGLAPMRTDYGFIFPRLLRVFRGLEPHLARLPLGAQFQVLGRKE